MRLLSCVLFVCATSVVVVAADEFKPEPGFKPLFNGKNLDGWQMKATGKFAWLEDKTDASTDGPAVAILRGVVRATLWLDSKTDAYNGRYKVKEGELVIDPKVKGDRYIETVQQFGGDFTIRFDFKPGEGCNNDVLLLGTKFDIKAGEKGGLKGVKVGEWSKMEIVVKSGSADFNVNGEKLGTQKTKGDKGPLIIRAEFEPITIKNIRATETK